MFYAKRFVQVLFLSSISGNSNIFSDGFIIKSPATIRARTALSPSSPFTHPSSLKATSPEFDEVCETTGVTLTRFMYEVEKVNPELSELAQLISGIQTAAKAISNLVKRSQLPSSSVLGLEGVVNVQGEDQKKLDVITNDVLKRALRHTGKVGVVASEEEDTPMNVATEKKDVIYDEGSSYVTVFDPLDGSSNVDAGIPTGKRGRDIMRI